MFPIFAKSATFTIVSERFQTSSTVPLGTRLAGPRPEKLLPLPSPEKFNTFNIFNTFTSGQKDSRGKPRPMRFFTTCGCSRSP
jgi:hypothetical protein